MDTALPQLSADRTRHDMTNFPNLISEQIFEAQMGVKRVDKSCLVQPGHKVIAVFPDMDSETWLDGQGNGNRNAEDIFQSDASRDGDHTAVPSSRVAQITDIRSRSGKKRMDSPEG